MIFRRIWISNDDIMCSLFEREEIGNDIIGIQGIYEGVF